jgi:Flp pilus assembly protein TadG
MRRHCIRRLIGNRNGNVALTFALTLIPIVFLTGMTLDFGVAIQKRAKLNAAADSAALAAVTRTMMNQSTAQATTAATNIFNAQASAISGATVGAPTVTITQSGLTRTATVAYTGSSANSFPSILNQAAWPLSGSATASATVAPNIDFYMLLDNSPSMAIAATTAGINTMIANTPQQGGGAGCAFACHQSSPNSGDTPGNANGQDNYALAKSLGVVTRIQNMALATQSLTSTAASLATQTGSTFRMGVYTFTSNNLGNELVAVQSLTSNLAQAGAAASAVDVLEVCKGNYVTCSTYDDATNTDFATAMSNINGIMATPGTGASSGYPQEILFIVTDGVEDKQATSCAYPMISLSGFQRCMQPFDTSMCTTIKNRGIQIAILYTEYYPLGSDSFYGQYVAPYQSQIGPNLQNCASSGLFYTVTTDQDITSALTSLFNAAVKSTEAHLSN